MSHTLLSKTGLQYLWGKLKAFFVKGNARIFYGTCDTAAATGAKVVTCPSFTSSDLDNGTMILVKFSTVNTASVDSLSLNVNNTGAFGIRKIYNDTSGNIIYPGEIRAITHIFVLWVSLDGETKRWYLVGGDVNTNTTYSSMTQAQLDDGTSTTGYRITPALLRDNFYTETEVDTLMGGKKIWAGTQAEYDLLTPDADTLYFITESSS